MPSAPLANRALVLLLCGVATSGATLHLRAEIPFLNRSSSAEDLTYAVGTVVNAIVVYALSTVAATLALRAGERPHVRRLMMLLSLWALAAGRYGFDLDTDKKAHLRIEIATCIVVGLLVFTMLRFAQTFPAPLRLADLMGWDPRGRTQGSAPSLIQRGKARAASAVYAGARSLLRPRVLRNAAAGTVVVTSLLSPWGDNIVYPVRNMAIVAAVLCSTCYLFTSYRIAPPPGRRRILWLLLSAVLVLPVGVLTLADTLATWMGGSPFFTYLVYLGYGLAMLSSIACLMIAVYGQGAVDPRLYLRRSITFALLSLPAVVLWVVIEGGASSWIASVFNLRQNSPWTLAVCGVLATVLTAPLKAPTEQWVKQMGHSLLDDDEGTASVVLAFAGFAGEAPRPVPAQGYRWSEILAQAAEDAAARYAADVLVREETGVLLAFRDPDGVLPGTRLLRNDFHRGFGALRIPAHPLRIGLYIHHPDRGTASVATLLEHVRRVAMLARASEIVATEAATSELVRQEDSAWEPAGEVVWDHAAAPVTCFRYRLPAQEA